MNMTDLFCYTTTFIVRLTDRTICSTVDCSTVFHNGTHDILEQFGSDTITTSKQCHDHDILPACNGPGIRIN